MPEKPFIIHLISIQALSSGPLDLKENILKKKEKKLNLLLSLSMSVSLIPALPVLAEEEPAPAAPGADIFPVPQSVITDSSEGVTLQGPVDVVVHGTRNHAAVEKTGALLDAQGIAWTEKTEEEAADSSNARITLAVQCTEDCTTCTYVGDAAGALEHAQGYVLQASDARNEKGEVTIVGSDKDGVYYGVMTLLQLYQQSLDGAIAEVTISDYPDILYRGYVEGFYGTPWTFDDRTSLFEETSLYKMNTYIYAPKDDPYHRASWRTLYPADKAEEIRSLVQTADDNNMIFCWTIHPGADYDYTTDADGDGVVDDYGALLEKIDQVYDLGVRQFGIFYDDLSESVANGPLHAQTLNNVYEHLKQKSDDIRPMVTVLTRYTNSWGASVSGYFTPFMEQIHPDTLVLWTGNSTMSAITKAYYEWPKTQSGTDRDFGSWWNYPVTDYYHGHLLMGPLECAEADVDNLASFYMNPMSEADASKVTIFSGADYSWNTHDFNAHDSWVRSIQELVPECWEEFCRFADNLAYNDQGNGFLFRESQYLKEDLQAFKDALQGQGSLEAATASVKADFQQILDDCSALRAVQNQGLLEEITPYVDMYEKLGQAGLGGMEALEAAASGNVQATMTGRAALLTQTEAVKNASYKVGSHILVPFLEGLQEQVNAVLADNLDLSQNCTEIRNGQETVLAETESGWQTGAVAPGETVVLRLRRPENFSAALQAASAAGLKVETSLNGLEWTERTLVQTENGFADPGIVTAAWVRLTAYADSQGAESLRIVRPQNPVNRSVYTNLPTYTAPSTGISYPIGNAFDGDLDTCFWSSRNSAAGDVLSVTLGGLYSVSSVRVVSGINRLDTVDAFMDGCVEVSLDGQTWTQVGENFSYTDFDETEEGDTVHAAHTVTFDPVEARYIRIRENGSGSYWLKIYEIAPQMELIESSACQVTTNMTPSEGSSPALALDGNPSTYLEASSSAGGTKTGDYVQVDLQNLTALYDASILFRPDAGFSSTQMEISVDGQNWTPAGSVIASDAYSEDGACLRAETNAVGALTRYIRFSAASDGDVPVQAAEIRWNEITGTAIGMTASTDMKTYQTNVIGNAVDGNPDTKFYSSAATVAGNYIQVALSRPVPIYDASIVYGGDPHKAGAVDGFSSTKLEYSMDGKNWNELCPAVASSQYKVVNGRYTCSFSADGTTAHYLRFTAAGDSSSWCQAYEIDVNQTLDTNNVRYTSGTATVLNSNRLDDGNLNTAPVFYQLTAGQTLVYPMTSVTDVKTLSILQHASSAGNTLVEAEKLDGSWTELGTLSEAYNVFEINDSIRSISLTFDGSVNPILYEIMAEGQPRIPEEQPEVNKVLLAQAIAYAEAEQEAGALENLNVTVKEYFLSAMQEAREVYADPAATAEDVQAAWLKLSRAIQMLDFKADKTLLAALLEQARTLAESPLTEESRAALEAAIAQAEEVLASETALQDRIDEALRQLQAAMDAAVLQEFSTEILELLIEAIESTNLDLYINADGEVDALLAACEQAKEVLAHPESQEQINETAASLNSLWLNLRLLPDESVLEALRGFVVEVRSLQASLWQPATLAMLTDLADETEAALNRPDLTQEESLALLEKVNAVSSVLRNPDGQQTAQKPVDEKPQTPAAVEKKDPVVIPSADELQKPDSTEASVSAESQTTARSVKTSAATGLSVSGMTALASLAALLHLKKRNRKNR